MVEELLQLIYSALPAAAIVMGIVQVIKKNTKVDGFWVIVLAISVGVLLLGAFAVIRGYPFAESLLIGVLAGLGAVGAFNGLQKGKEEFGGDQ